MRRGLLAILLFKKYCRSLSTLESISCLFTKKGKIKEKFLADNLEVDKEYEDGDDDQDIEEEAS